MKGNYIIKHIAGTLVFYAVIFISAGTIRYMPGLIYTALGVAMTILGYTLLHPGNELLEERGKPGKDTDPADKTILLPSFLATAGMFVTAGLDSGRYHWSAPFSTLHTIAGIILTAGGQLLFLVAQKQNAFFSSTIRLQTDRNHKVCDSGLYSFLRHPGYFGSLIQAVGFPFLFHSVFSAIPVLFSVILIVIRTQREDRFLKQHLNGYPEYAEKVRYKLIRGIW